MVGQVSNKEPLGTVVAKQQYFSYARCPSCRLAIFSVNIHGNLRQQLTIFREHFDWPLRLTFDRCRSYRDLLQ